jgi:ATP-dependent DNA helicase
VAAAADSQPSDAVPSFAFLKITDPGGTAAPVAPGADLRVLLPEGEQFAVLHEKLAAGGAQVRRVRYLLEEEAITGATGRADDDQLAAVSCLCRLNQRARAAFSTVTGSAAAAARDAFDAMWHDHAPVTQPDPPATPADVAVPPALARFLPFRELNPAQAQALPEIFGHDHNLLVVAPTGAGKTVIGMAALLRAVVQQRRKAAWLVPQRSLTDELDSELAGWRRQGLRVERLSGEHAVDIDRIHDADLWVATTEKFEAICRTSAFRESLADVGSLVVDEIHLLGDPARGPVLETLLARIRDSGTATRIVGLSATISNAPQVAEWLRAVLLRSSWRPGRLTWQLPAIAAHSDFTVTEAARIRLTAAITGLVTSDGGSVLVFCGSKRNVRRAALVIAASRGVDVSRSRPDDLERLRQVCREARIGLHYQGWEHRRADERAFRQRDTDVLIATSTVAAGVNLPARAVIIQDTQVGLEPLDVATAAQMFGRAGRIGVGEDQGWAFMIVDERERAAWQAQLVAGHTVHSRIQDDLPEQVLSEAVQQRITTRRHAEQWWMQTLAYHQGQRSLSPLRKAVEFLGAAQMLTMTDLADGGRLVPTELGRLTARLMISPVVCADLRRALASTPVPASAEEAEAALARILAAWVPKLAQARVGNDGKAALARLLASEPARQAPAGRADRGLERGDLARAALLAVAGSPGAFYPGVRHISGVPYAAMYPILEEAPRYLHWLACQGSFGTIHPCWAVVAADLEQRTAWRMLQPPRGAGRLLWACEQMATPAHAAQAVPELWAAARARGYRSPDWAAGRRPAQCRLDDAGYVALLRDRATGTTIEVADGKIRATGPAGSVLAVWNGPEHRITSIRRGQAAAEPPAPGAGELGAAIFTWRSDYRATGWLAAYSRIP